MPVLTGGQQGEPLPKLPGLPVVKLQPILTADNKTVISITFKPCKSVYETLMRSSLTNWQREQKCFAIPEGGQYIQQLTEELEGVGWLWLSQELVVRNVVLLRGSGSRLTLKGQTTSPAQSTTWKSSCCLTIP
ncbi:hypothetical protein [Pontibacter sp. H249]|uniref:hypothetical protein n=1 Tax=Pontibacter sp. H249 TaxID=3133420 RepID=UPI0030C43B24